MIIKNNKGQSTVEYVLLVTAVVAVMIMFTTNRNTGMQSKLNETLETATDGMGTLSTKLDESRAASPAGTSSNASTHKTDPLQDPFSGGSGTGSGTGTSSTISVHAPGSSS